MVRFYLGLLILFCSALYAEEIKGPYPTSFYEEREIYISPLTHNVSFYLEGNKISLENRGKDSSCLVLTSSKNLYIIPVYYGRTSTLTVSGDVTYVQCSNVKGA